MLRTASMPTRMMMAVENTRRVERCFESLSISAATNDSGSCSSCTKATEEDRNGRKLTIAVQVWVVKNERFVGDVLVLKYPSDAGKVVKELESRRGEGGADGEGGEASPEECWD